MLLEKTANWFSNQLIFILKIIRWNPAECKQAGLFKWLRLIFSGIQLNKKQVRLSINQKKPESICHSFYFYLLICRLKIVLVKQRLS